MRRARALRSSDTRTSCAQPRGRARFRAGRRARARAGSPANTACSRAQRTPAGGAKRLKENSPDRTQEIQRLIGRALRSVTDMKALGENTITLDCDVLQADGGTRTAAITGAYVALALAMRYLKEEGVIKTDPLSAQVAAVSCGIFNDVPVLDLDYPEDSAAQVDANFVSGLGRQADRDPGHSEQRAFSRAEFTCCWILPKAAANSSSPLSAGAGAPARPGRPALVALAVDTALLVTFVSEDPAASLQAFAALGVLTSAAWLATRARRARGEGDDLMAVKKRKVDIKSRRLAYKGRYKVEEFVFDFDRAAGKGRITDARREVFERGDSAAALIHDIERDVIVLAEQFRMATFEKGPGYLVEAMAGSVEEDEEPEACIRREMLEEVGYRAGVQAYRQRLCLARIQFGTHLPVLRPGEDGRSGRPEGDRPCGRKGRCETRRIQP